VHDEWIRHVWNPEKDTSLQAHRNSYKTTAVLVVGCIWNLLARPDDRILIIRKTLTDSAGILSEIKSQYESEKMQHLYSLIGVENIKTDRWRVDSMTLSTKSQPSKEGNIDAIGVGGSLTGRHYERIRPDDIITTLDRYSRAEREKTKHFIAELNNIKTQWGEIGYTGTPWHTDDGWSMMPDPLKCAIGERHINGFRYDLIDQLKKSMSLSLWAANYELKHISDEGRIFSDPVYEEWPDQLQPIAILDPAYKGKNNTSLVIGGKYNGLIYFRGWTWRKDVTQMYGDIIKLLSDYKSGTLHVESNADKGMAAKELKKIRGTGVEEYHEKENKHMRIITYVRGKQDILRVAPDCQSEFVANWIDYQEGIEPDDEADALAGLIRKLSVAKKNIHHGSINLPI